MNVRLGLIVWAGVCVFFAGCTPQTAPENTKLVVFAAASLTDVVRDFERDFEGKHPHIDVQTTFSGSHVLFLQIQNGAPADVFISADHTHIQAMLKRKTITAKRLIAHNELIAIVPTSNPAKIERFEDLSRASRIVLGAPNAPIGQYTERLFEKVDAKRGPALSAHVRKRTVSQENNTRLVRMKLELGVADAAIVYRTDGLSSERVRAVEIPKELNVRTACWSGVVARTKRPKVSSMFVNAMVSSEGKHTLKRHGFLVGEDP